MNTNNNSEQKATPVVNKIIQILNEKLTVSVDKDNGIRIFGRLEAAYNIECLFNEVTETKAPVLRWVKASDRLPEAKMPIFFKYTYPNYPVEHFAGALIDYGNGKKYFVAGGLSFDYWHMLEWLEEIPAPEADLPSNVGDGQLTEFESKVLDETYKNSLKSERTKEGASQSEVPQMDFDLAAQSDIAAIEYGRHCDRFIGERAYDSSHITEAHEQGQMWMYRRLQSHLSAITAERDEALLIQAGIEEGAEEWKAQYENLLARMKNTKPWPVGGYAPGNYSCTCCYCTKSFTGDKRAVACLDCSLSGTHVYVENLRDERDAALKEVDSLTTWIDVKDRAPEIHQDVAFIVDSPGGHNDGRILGGKYLGKRMYDYEFSTPGHGWSATLWCPMPAKP